ncbi:MAG TPA: UDP-N-acetylmuramate dehydrogenase [Clostridiaceae bacterium]|nr:UDP-N-acetylmuramate dehydrogenase [Clostridiaceae bacterium]
MNKYLYAYEALASILTKEEILLDEPMKNHTWFEIGGRADVLVMPDSVDKLVKIMNYISTQQIPTFLIGNGSNLLVKDGGIRGIVIKTDRISGIHVRGSEITVECGALLEDISTRAYEEGLTGFEFACGIPGTLGGAVFMNAGAYDGEMSFVLKEVRVITPELQVMTVKKEDLELGYRTSVIKTKNYVVLDAVLSLEKGSKEEIKEKIEDLTKRREDRQPLEFPSAGSTFKRPTGHYAGKLIQDAGLKGYQVGGAQVSEKHSGFVINKDHAEARDVLNLISYIQSTVMDKFNVELCTEVLIVGED